ncbi:MAG: cyclic lactone autoinducer peptide [Oscillospiraceae bacterium]
MKKTLKSSCQKAVASVTSAALKASANSASCVFIYQPKKPMGLDKFSKIKK